MKQTLAFLLLFLSGFTNVFAGTEDYKLIPKDTVRAACAFNKVKLLDLRVKKDDFGYIKTGALNSTKMLQPENPEQMLVQFIEQVCSKAKTKEDKTLLVVLKNYRITDRAVSGELGTFYVRMAFYIGDKDQYQQAFSVDSFFETASGWDVTNAILGMANLKMTKWVMKAAQYKETTGKDAFYTEKEIIDMVTGKPNFPIYNEAPKEGIYLTEEDFLNNRPVEGDLMTAHDENSVIYRIYKKNDKGKFKINLNDESWFAAYTKGKWFKKTSIGVCKMEFSNNDFYFPEAGTGLRANDDIAIMFGLIGSMIANNSKGSTIYNMRYTPATNSGQAVARLQ